jgi:glutathione S-transferase
LGVRATLYAIPASNAVLTAQLALERKGIPYRRVDQLPVVHRIGMRARGFQGSTVPGLVIDGRKVHGSSAILRELDRLEPEPPLFPADPALLPPAEEALRWGEDVYQCTLRNLLPWSLLHRPSAVASVLQDARMTLPTSLVVRVAKPAIYVNSLINSSNEEMVRRRLAELPGMFDHVDELIASGVLNAEEPGAADLMIAPTTCAFLWWEELRPLLDGRAAADHARRVVPRFPGEIPPVFPRDAVPAPAPAA